MQREPALRFDPYIMNVLMRDLVAHDKQPSAFLVYLFLHARSQGGKRVMQASLREIAEETGLSKSVVQMAVQNLRRRQLIASKAAHRTATPSYRIFQPWRRLGRRARARSSASAKGRGASL